MRGLSTAALFPLAERDIEGAQRPCMHTSRRGKQGLKSRERAHTDEGVGGEDEDQAVDDVLPVAVAKETLQVHAVELGRLRSGRKRVRVCACE